MTRRQMAAMLAFLVGLPAVSLATDANQLHSVMVKPSGVVQSNATGSVIQNSAQLDAIGADWSSTTVPPPQRLADVADALPMHAGDPAVFQSPSAQFSAPAAVNSNPMRLALPTPPGQAGAYSGVVQTQFEAELPAPNEPAATQPAATGVPTNDVTQTPSGREESITVGNPQTESATVVDSSAKAAARAAGDLLAQSLKVSDNDEHFDRPIRLQEVISHYVDRGLSNWQQGAKDYWSLSHAVGVYQWQLDELKRLEHVVPGRGTLDAPLLATARASASAELGRVEIELAEAQQRLAQGGRIDSRMIVPAAHLAGTGEVDPRGSRFFPADRPLVGPYITYFQQLAASRLSANPAAPIDLDPRLSVAQRVDRNLPIRLKMINDLAAAVQSAASAVHYAEEAHARGEADMQLVLACHTALHDQRRAFLQEVRTYNQEIADYVASIATPATSTDKIVAMLIRVEQRSSNDQASRVSAAPRPNLAPSLGRVGPPMTSSAPIGNLAAPPSNAPLNDRWMPSTRRAAEPIDPNSPTDAAPAQNHFMDNDPASNNLPYDNNPPSSNPPHNAAPRYPVDQFQQLDQNDGITPSETGAQGQPHSPVTPQQVPPATDPVPAGDTTGVPQDQTTVPEPSAPASEAPRYEGFGQ